MLYRIDEISSEVSTGATYVLVSFWLSQGAIDRREPPYLTNDFLMQLAPAGVRTVTNNDGWPKRLSDGVFIDPATLVLDDKTKWEREVFTVDLPAQIRGNIDAYIANATANEWAGDHTGDAAKPFYVRGKLVRQGPTPAFVRDDVDRAGVLARADVQALKQ